MMAKRIIPCLDIKKGRTVKGIQFKDLVDAGDPLSLAKFYNEEGADELVFLDISATVEDRKILLGLVEEISEEINIPFTIGGGVSSVEDVYALLRAGADKVSVNSAALRNPNLINQLAKEFGTQCITVAIDAYLENGWIVFIAGGSINTGIELLAWAKEVADRGAGEILFTSMNQDGAKSGFALQPLRKISDSIPIPLIASGGAGRPEHFYEVFAEGKADAALAASVFHFGEIKIPDLKNYLKTRKILVR